MERPIDRNEVDLMKIAMDLCAISCKRGAEEVAEAYKILKGAILEDSRPAQKAHGVDVSVCFRS